MIGSRLIWLGLSGWWLRDREPGRTITRARYDRPRLLRDRYGPPQASHRQRDARVAVANWQRRTASRERRARVPAIGGGCPKSRTDKQQRLLTQAPATGVVWVASWSCGRNAQPKPGCHRRRDLRHEARGGGYWL